MLEVFQVLFTADLKKFDSSKAQENASKKQKSNKNRKQKKDSEVAESKPAEGECSHVQTPLKKTKTTSARSKRIVKSKDA